jgi:hypothetical protein
VLFADVGALQLYHGQTEFSLEEDRAMAYIAMTRDQHFQNPGPKRILALDGGGLRGIVTLG